MRIATSFLLFGLSACTTLQAQYAPTKPDQIFKARTPPEKIALYRSQAPAELYQEIGIVNACCNADPEVLLNELKAKAAESGGDGILSVDVQAVGGATATVIRFNR